MPDRPAIEFSVKVTGVPEGTSSHELRAVFEAAGFHGITDVYLPARFAKFEYGFIRFADELEAEDAAAKTGLEVRGSPLRCEISTREKRQCPITSAEPVVQFFDRTGPQSGRMGMAGSHSGRPGLRTAPAASMVSRSVPKTNEASVWVGGLPDGTTADDLREAAENLYVSNMTDVYVPPGDRGFGFLRFAERREAEEAAQRCEGIRVGDIALELKLSFSEKARLGPPVAVAEPLISHNLAMGGMQFIPKTNEASVWVGRLPHDTTAGDLREVAESYGVLDMTDVYVPPGDRGFGFLRFVDRRDAEAAMHACEGLRLGGNALEFKLSIAEKAKVGPAMVVRDPIVSVERGYPHRDFSGGVDHDRGRGPAREAMEVSVKISNLPPKLGVEGLREALVFECVDSMSDVYIPRGRSFGFVRFRSLGEAQACLQLDGIQIGSNRVIVELADGEKKTAGEMAGPLDVDRGRGSPRSSSDFPAQSQPSSGSASRGARDNEASLKINEVSLKVSNIPLGCSPPDICEAFASCEVDFMTDCYIPRGKTYAFIRFASAAEARCVLDKDVWMGDRRLEIELAQGSKRSSGEMHGRELVRESLAPPLKRMRETHVPTDVPDNPETGADTPSVRVSRLTLGASSEELHAAFREAGCRGRVTDVYVPKGNRGYGFVRFSNMRDAQEASELPAVYVRGQAVELELAVASRKTKPTAGGFAPPGGGGRGFPPYGPARGVHPGGEGGGRFASDGVGPYSVRGQPDRPRGRQDDCRAY